MNKTKLLVGISMAVFFLTVFSMVGAGLWVMKQQEKKTINTANQVKEELAKSGEVQSANEVLTTNDVAEHKTAGDCWIIISDKVYNVTSYLIAHPGGAAIIVPYCGGDATQAFASKDKRPGKDHSQMAHEMLAQYYVATIGEKKSDIAQLQPTLAPGQPTPTLKPGQPTPTVAVMPTAKPIATNTNVNTAVTLSAGEVASHNTLANCWMIISGKVYDITSYVYQHPGGASVIAPYCGKDGTNAFATKNTGSSHSSYAHNLLNNFLVGTLGSSIVIPTINPSSPTPTIAPGVVVPTATTVPGQAGGNNQPTATPVPQNLNLTSAEVANHNTLQNCWMIVSNKVYNVTSYVYQHPGGANAIAPYCGKDGTTAFATRGGTGSHSNNANNLLNNYLIGTLNSSVPVVPTNTPVPGAPTNTPAPGAPTNTPVPSGSSGLPAAITDKYPGATKRSGGYEDNGSWEGKINTAGGQCREMKVNSGGSITQDQGC